MKKYNRFFLLVCLVNSIAAYSQEVLTIDDAISIAIEKNYDLRIARNNVESAKVETSVLGKGYLPSVSAGGGMNYSDENQNVVFTDGTSTSVNGAITESYNASVTAEYTLFDGLERKFNNRKNKENVKYTELQERQEIENTFISIYENYYNVAYQEAIVANWKLTVANSKDRLERAKLRFQYGQGNKLDELNAEVDLNRDSISYAAALRDLNNFKRNFNLLLGRDSNTLFIADSTVGFIAVPKQEVLLKDAEENNIQMALADENILLSDLDIKINKAKYLPKITGSGSYSWSESQNPPTGFSISNESYGINLGLNLSWNLFDGGRTQKQIQKAKITKDTRQIEMIKVKEQLRNDVYNSYEVYENAQFTYSAEAKNVATNELNFERTQQQFSLGQVTAIEFRQAQINLFNARNNYSKAKFDLKIAEISLKQLSGKLLD